MRTEEHVFWDSSLREDRKETAMKILSRKIKDIIQSQLQSS